MLCPARERALEGSGVPWRQGGKLVRALKGHGHWVNTLALSTECALRTGAHDHHGRAPSDPGAAKQVHTHPLATQLGVNVWPATSLLAN